MLTGDQLRAARERAGWTQQQLANRVGVTLRSVGNWERSSVPTNQLNKVRDALADYLPGDTPGRGVDLHEISDARLLAEIARRFDRGREEQTNGTATTSQARESRAERQPATESEQQRFLRLADVAARRGPVHRDLRDQTTPDGEKDPSGPERGE